MFTQEKTTEELQKELADITRRVVAMENEQRRVREAPYLDRNLDNQSKDIIQQEISRRMIDIVWNEYFYYLSYFDAGTGWDVVSQAVVPVSASAMELKTTTVADNESIGYKDPFGQEVLSFDFPSRFRTNFTLAVDTTAANIRYWLGVGAGAIVSNYKRYGFRLENSTMYGVVADGTNETKVALFTTESSQGGGAEIFPRLLEARFYPGNRVDFYASDVGDEILKPITSISTTLPSGAMSDGWLEFRLVTTTTTAKQAYVGFAEYIQQKKPL